MLRCKLRIALLETSTNAQIRKQMLKFNITRNVTAQKKSFWKGKQWTFDNILKPKPQRQIQETPSFINTKLNTCLKSKWTLKQVFVQTSATKKGRRGPSSIHGSLVCTVEQGRDRIRNVLLWPCFEKVFYCYEVLQLHTWTFPTFICCLIF